MLLSNIFVPITTAVIDLFNAPERGIKDFLVQNMEQTTGLVMFAFIVGSPFPFFQYSSYKILNDLVSTYILTMLVHTFTSIWYFQVLRNSKKTKELVRNANTYGIDSFALPQLPPINITEEER